MDGSTLKYIREQLGYTTKSIASFLDMSVQEYENIESDVSKLTMSQFEKLCNLYYLEPYDVLTMKPDELDLSRAFHYSEFSEDDDLKEVAQFSKIVQNYMKMSRLLNDENNKENN